MTTVFSCPEVRALKSNEKEMIKSLRTVDLESLCGEAVEIGVVPQNVKKSLESMDWENVPSARVIKYLLMHVYKKIDDNFRLYKC